MYDLFIIESRNKTEEEILNLFEEFNNDEPNNNYIKKCGNDYHHEEDLIAFSKKYPDVIFLLEGYSWKLYVKDGFSQYCTNNKFNKGKLLADIRDAKINKII